MFSNTAQTERDVHNSISHSAFNVLNILIGIRYIKEWWPHIIRIIYTFWNFTCQNAYSLSKAWLHHPPTPSIHLNFSEPPTDSLLLPGTGSTFYHDSRLPHHHSITSEISSKTLKNFLHFLSTTSYECKLQTVSALWKTGITTKLTLRQLMLYIYMEQLFLMFLDHTRRRTSQ